MKYMQPRPSSIVAALYTARDLGVDVAVLHGPSGCSFKHARLLEEDGMRVLTTSLADHEFIFGGQEPLENVLRHAEEAFAPRRMAVVGTCVSMIIGEDLRSAVAGSGVATPTIAIDIHAGYPENIEGVPRESKRGGTPAGCRLQTLYRAVPRRPQAPRREAARRPCRIGNEGDCDHECQERDRLHVCR